MLHDWKDNWNNFIAENQYRIVPYNCRKQTEKINKAHKLEKIPQAKGGGEKEVILQTHTSVYKCDVKRIPVAPKKIKQEGKLCKRRKQRGIIIKIGKSESGFYVAD